MQRGRYDSYCLSFNIVALSISHWNHNSIHLHVHHSTSSEIIYKGITIFFVSCGARPFQRRLDVLTVRGHNGSVMKVGKGIPLFRDPRLKDLPLPSVMDLTAVG